MNTRGQLLSLPRCEGLGVAMDLGADILSAERVALRVLGGLLVGRHWGDERGDFGRYEYRSWRVAPSLRLALVFH